MNIGRGFPLFKPHPQFHIFKKISSFQNLLSPEGKNGFVEITKEYPGNNGVVVEHIHKSFGNQNEQNISSFENRLKNILLKKKEIDEKEKIIELLESQQQKAKLLDE